MKIVFELPLCKGTKAIQINNDSYTWNYIRYDGEMLLKHGFYNVASFCNGFAQVQREDGLWNFIDKYCNILSSQWFYDAYNFQEKWLMSVINSKNGIL